MAVKTGNKKKKKKRGNIILFIVEILILVILVGLIYVYAQINSGFRTMAGDSGNLDNILINENVATNESLSGYTNVALVGPRPERPFFVEKFQEEIPRYMVKHQVRPGMTGWAQVNGYRGDTSIRRRIDCDLYYIENWSIGLDIKILFLTVFKGFINNYAY